MKRLSESDRRAWEAYRTTADPLERSRRALAVPDRPGVDPDGPPHAAPKREARPLPRFRIGQKAPPPAPRHDLAPSVRDAVRGAPVAMDARAFHRLRAGKLRPDAKLDLHGMTLERAFPALQGFVMRANAEGKRLLLVVTGKGKRRDEGGPIPTRTGVLRHQVPQWLRMPPLAPLVLQVAEAHRSHGGSGAYYVYLRRSR
ncbi:Smr/MutS family protein [Jannaschia sp. W003]|uniref:Smr/MutS family protein n=1 Tax=Jannaschia sp. W003 TaxID=2867012 RepID=UPI0021A4BB35|nr:Smr/MutS family protein [Jannaschia sp. W003]UWQ21980.1 Smr/MutS family protein [Jannaschia sp. W003]